MKRVSMRTAKAHLSQLVREINAGVETEIIIAVGATPAARPGSTKGYFRCRMIFDAPLREIEGLN